MGRKPRRGAPPAAARSESISPARWLLACAGIAAAALIAGLPTLHFQFLSWDDSAYVTQNPWIRGWSAENLIHIFTKPWFVSYMPLQLVSYMADYSFWGLDPTGYHLQQILLHTVDAVLAFVLVQTLFGRYWVALIAALLFAVHPSHVEAVAWVSARKDVLSAAFLLPAIVLYLKSKRRPALYFASLAFFALAVLARVNVIVAPLFLVLVDLLAASAPRKGWLKILADKIPYAAIGFGIALVNWIVQPKSNASYARDAVHYVVLKGHAAWDYFAILTGIPRQNPIYNTPPVLLDATAVIHLAGLLLLPALFWVGYRRRDRILALGAGWIFVMLLPALFFPVLTYIADRYLYLPSLGFCWILAAGILAVSRRLKPQAARTAAAVLLTAALTVFFAIRTGRYNRVWESSETLWSYTIEASKDFRAFNNLARVRMEQNRWDDAERLFALGSRQANVISWDGLTAVYYKTGRYALALQANAKAFKMHALKPDDTTELAELHYKRGCVYLAQSEVGKAIEDLEEALRVNPRHPDARRMLDFARQAAGNR